MRIIHFSGAVLAAILLVQCGGQGNQIVQPTLGARHSEIIEDDGFQFRDLNKNATLDPYEDWRLSVDERIGDLVGRMTVEEKIGLMFHPNIAVTPDGIVKYDLSEEEKAALAGQPDEEYAGPVGPGGQAPEGGAMANGQMFSSATAKSFIEEKNFRNILNNGVAAPREFATWSNSMQEIAEKSRLGIPIMFSTDPRHGATLGAHVSGTQYFSQWPSKEGQVGITASRNPDLLKKFGEVTAEEYRAVGLHMILGPQIDLMTEPRWGRNMGAFSEDAELTATMMAAYMEGAQGEKLGPGKILVHLKHWPGAGPHENGGGEWLVYPGDNLDYQLIPWKKGIEKGALAVMGYYSGTYVDSFNVCYSPHWSTEVIYNQLGFKGAICTDWGVVSRVGPMNPRYKGKTTLKDNMAMVINAGVDQMGSETENQLLIELVQEGRVSEERINTAARRILQWHFLLGLFENPYVDPDQAELILQSDKNQALGYQAQLESIILLSNSGILPIAENTSLYIEGIDRDIAASYATLVEKPEDADLILVRSGTSLSGDPFGQIMEFAKTIPAFAGIDEPQQLMAAIMEALQKGETPDGEPIAMGDLMGGSEEINIEIPQEIWSGIQELQKTGVPVVVAFNPSGSSVVLPSDLKEVTAASLMVFDVMDNALMDVISGKFNPKGKLPFEIPSSMEAVRNQLEDVPFDSKDPMFSFNHGLHYE